MPYRPQAPPPVVVEDHPPEVYAGSPISEKPVTSVTAVTRATPLLEMPLDQFEREGRPIQVRVPGLRETLWFVPGCSDGEALVSRGIGRGRIWTARELMEIWKVPGLTREQAQTLARIKLEFEADIVSVEPLTTEPEPNRAEE